MCEWFDETCGELLGHLEKENLAENTIVVYVTDNGWIQSPTTGGFAPKSKTSPFDAGHRTPILVRWPVHLKPGRSMALASSIDLVPTVLAALQLPAPEELRGINLLDAKALEKREHVFGEDYTIRSQTLDDVNANVVWRWVTDGRWRLILPRTFEAEGSLKSIPPDNYLKPYLIAALEAAQPMLYDLESDPQEETNVADKHPEVVSALRARGLMRTGHQSLLRNDKQPHPFRRLPPRAVGHAPRCRLAAEHRVPVHRRPNSRGDGVLWKRGNHYPAHGQTRGRGGAI